MLNCRSGSCRIDIDFASYRDAGDDYLRIEVVPNDLRSLAAKIIQQCVTLQGGIGGFGTLKIEGLLSYAAQGFTPYNVLGFPTSTTFLTVSVWNLSRRSTNPASMDLSIALALAQAATGASISGHPYRGLSVSQVWIAQASRMSRSSRSPKWYSTSSQVIDQMNYQCDAELGTPSVTDCSKVEWEQLGPPSDTLAIGPGATTFLHSNTCYLAISAAISIVLTWAQIRSAAITLMDVCLQTPNQAARGGRAYYAPPHQLSGRKGRKRQVTDSTGLNALPAGTNITIFEQKETWISTPAELTSCTWEAILRRSPVSTCVKQ